MTFEQYWQSLCKANSKMKDDGKMIISVASFKSLMLKSYNNGYDHKAEHDAWIKKQTQKPYGGDLFGDIFKQ